MASVPGAALPRPKLVYFGLDAVTTLASSYYFNYLFFFLRDEFGFGNRGNLAVAALHGSLYVVAAWRAGHFADRHGLHFSLKIGFGGLATAMIVGGLFASVLAVQLVVVATYSIMLLFIWPALHALVSRNEPPVRVPHLIGLYNCTWGSMQAVAYFTGGVLYASLGTRAVFWLPAVLYALQFALVARLAPPPPADGQLPGRAAPVLPPHPDPLAYRRAANPVTFLKLGWTANPFSYVAIYTLFAVMPGLAQKFSLSPAEIGLVGSIWLFGRLAAFVGLWLWPGWHYSFRWLAAGYAALTLSFAAIVLAPWLLLMVVAQAVFGLAAGLMYYSSLFYAMDVGEARAGHGGLHEAALGFGICAGPAVGAASLQFFPHHPLAGSLAVSGLLVAGFGVLMTIWRRDGR